MQKFTIKDIENMCGIKAHTLRIWEQRYEFFKPKRKESQHRFYDNEDLKQLLRVAFLYHYGWKVSKIASFSQVQILEEVRKIESAGANQHQAVLSLMEAAIDFDEKAFAHILNDLTSRFGLERCILDICFPFLQRVGLLWMTNNIIPAQEHFSSYLIQHKIISETQKLPNSKVATPGILLFTPDGEYHELPLLFIHYLLKLNGWRIVYLGAAIKLDHVKEVIKQDASIDYLFIHSITNFTKYDIDDYLELLVTSFPSKKIIASGASIQSATRSFLDVQLLKSDADIHNFIYKKATT
jgi:DNA-binding transcriptional MerR regulator